MNLFILDTDPIDAAQMQCDKHVVKMPLETAQMLCTVHRMYGHDNPALYKPTHARHPCTLWIAESETNYHWANHHFSALAFEYTYRYGRRHKSYETLWPILLEPPAGMPDIGLTPFAQAMPDAYKHPDPVVAYRAYYQNAKAELLQYTKRARPVWLDTPEKVAA